jgi:ABC-type transport system substrate-binding protein
VGILNRPLSLQAWKIRDGASTLIGNQIHRGLLYVDPMTGTYLPHAASSWAIESKKGEIAFDLDQKIRFSDGTPVQCKDVAESLLRLLDKSYESSVALPKETQVLCDGPAKLQLRLKSIPAKFLDILASPVAGITKKDGLTGIGPYRLAHDGSQMIALERVSGSGPRRIEFRVGSHESLVSQFRRKEVDDILYLGLFQDVDADCERVIGLSPTSFWLGVNARSWLFRDKSLRLAVLELIREGLSIRNIFSSEIRNSTLIPFGISGNREPSGIKSEEVIVRLEKALARLTASHGPIQVTLRKAHEQAYDWPSLMRTVDPKSRIFKFEFLENDVFFKRYYGNQLTLFMVGANVTRNDPFEVLSFFRSKDHVNQSGVHQSVVDDLHEQAGVATSSEEVTRLARRANDWIISQGYALPLFSKRFSGCVQKNLSGYQISPLGPLSIDYSKVRIHD